MKMYELLEVLGENVEIKLYDKDNMLIGNFLQMYVGDFECLKENYFNKVIEEISCNGELLKVKLKYYSQLEHKAIEEMIKLGVHSRSDFLKSVFFKLEHSDFNRKEELKKYTFTRECVNNLKFLSKCFNNGWGGAHLVVLNNGEWFEIYQKGWGTSWWIGNHSQGQEEDYFYKYLREKN